MTQIVTAEKFRKSFKKYIDEVADHNEKLIVMRPHKKNVVLISEKEYNSWQETNYLLRTRANRKALAHSINQLGNVNR
ncbi:type II toxin-antitoxin system Phd/YefM family antitoxin [Limosilactobacillus sp.]|jgi:antitoxin YefM|uniref:type II toxin-antitoxin system Phd/YefM family antitoxin n=1 Tax=Limosilactobacillus sp. TaxID=2773925 RepID=UPI0025B8F4A1|nr:type II toxin-antitoxin system Phd/YefM family antitoxin [Limosilactobacillus sp.]MCI2031726.1 type II toxin-antitoxin system Phd/YefM family antitoxin [Limosilactobacillus sp.]